MQVGGVPAVLKYLLQKGFLHGDCMTVTGEAHGLALRAQYKYVDCRVEVGLETVFLSLVWSQSKEKLNAPK